MRFSACTGIAIVLCGAVSLAFAQGVTPAAPVPLESFSRLPFLENVDLSPDGHAVSYLQNQGGNTYVVYQPVSGADRERKILANSENRTSNINWIQWAGDEDILVSIRFPAVRFGTPTTETRLFVADVKSGQMHPILKIRRDDWSPQFVDNVIALLPDDPQHLLLAADLEEALKVGVYRVGVKDQSRKRVQAPRTDVWDWLADRSGEVRIGVGYRGTTLFVIGRSAREKDFRELWNYDTVRDAGPEPLGFGADPDVLYVRAPHEGRYALFRMDLTDPGLPKTLVVSDPKYDIGGDLIYSPKKRDVVGVYYEGSSGRYNIWDPDLKALQLGIDKGLPGAINRVVALSRDESRYVVLSYDGNKPGYYYYGDRNTKQLTPLASTYPELEDVPLSSRRAVTIRARDGLELEGIVSVPAGGADGALPAVILPHGGPGGRDDAGFDYWVEFLASRGYAVLQVNFRGSSGYGVSFEQASVEGWGLAMQDDVTDATQWLIAQGIADPARICIAGGSYGGYAALMGIVRNPDMYRCAISFAGVTDLSYLKASSMRYVNNDVVDAMLGDDWGDSERLRETSPVMNVDKMHVPLLIIHGSDDRVVRIGHSERLVKRLKAAGKPHEYVVFDGGDHYLSNQDHRTRFFQAVESFLAAHVSTTR
jgi:dipeptidyl aminopeptidase/acylaminoacyl peptidase